MSQENEKDWSLALKVANIAPITGSVSIRSSTALAIQRRIEQLEADRAQRGEPVAWMVVGAGENMHAETCKESAELWVKNQTNAGSPYSFSVHPLYTAPQPSQQERKPMTEAEAAKVIREASKGSATRRDGTTSVRIVRAVEAFHEITEKP